MSLITRIDPAAPSSKIALAAEQALFAHYGLDYKIHFLDMVKPALRIRILEVGEGRPLLLVPGGSGEAQFLVPLMAQLTGWRIIAINRPGGGLSDAVNHREVDLRQLAIDTISTTAEAFKLDNVPIICNSMGGLWSFWYALAFPERVTAMVQLGCPALILGTSAPFFMRLLTVPGVNRLIAGNMQPKTVNEALDGLRYQGSQPEDIARMPQVAAVAAHAFFNLPTYQDTWTTLVGAVANVMGARSQYQLGENELAQVDCPVQFVWGENDPFGGLKVAREAVRLMPKATLHAMKCGHLPFLDKPVETGRVVNEFLATKVPITANDALVKGQ